MVIISPIFSKFKSDSCLVRENAYTAVRMTPSRPTPAANATGGTFVAASTSLTYADIFEIKCIKFVTI